MYPLFYRSVLLDHFLSHIHYCIGMCIICRELVERRKFSDLHDKSSLLSGVVHQTWACEGLLIERGNNAASLLNLLQSRMSSLNFSITHLLLPCSNNSSHDITSYYTLSWECIKDCIYWLFQCFFGFKKYWFEGYCWNFLQTPWLWNTKECWYNYPYQVKAF